MSKAAEKREQQFNIYRGYTSRLALMREALEAGKDNLDGEPVNSNSLANEIVGKYRSQNQCLKDKENGVSYDGPLREDIQLAIEAGIKYGFHIGYLEAQKAEAVQ